MKGMKKPGHGVCVNPPLMSRPQPQCPWEIIAMDAMSVAGKDVMIFVDAFTHYPGACVVHEGLNGRSLSESFILHVFSWHGCPSNIIFDNVSYQIVG